jgi:hypothetical protein
MSDVKSVTGLTTGESGKESVTVLGNVAFNPIQSRDLRMAGRMARPMRLDAKGRHGLNEWLCDTACDFGSGSMTRIR